jgi:hypothetical protein
LARSLDKKEENRLELPVSPLLLFGSEIVYFTRAEVLD